MNNYDDLFNSNDKIDKSKDKNKNTPFDKDAWIEKKRQERAEAYELLDEATAEIVSDGKVIGYFGEVSPQVITDFEVNHPVIMFELIIQQFAERMGGGLF